MSELKKQSFGIWVILSIITMLVTIGLLCYVHAKKQPDGSDKVTVENPKDIGICTPLVQPNRGVYGIRRCIDPELNKVCYNTLANISCVDLEK